MHVVQQLDFVAQFPAADVKEFEGAAGVHGGLEYRLVVQRLHGGHTVRTAVAGHAGNADLHADVAESLRHEAARGLHYVGEIGAAGVGVTVDGLAAFSARKLVHRHAGLPALDVPERLVHAADGVVQHRAVLPVGAVVTGLPDVFDAVGVLAHQERLQVAFHRRLHQVGALREGGAAVAVETVLVGSDLHHGEPHAFGLALDHADVFDLRDWHGPAGASRFLL